MLTSFRNSLFYRITTPGLLVFTLFSYLFGIGLAHYLGAVLNWLSFSLGMLLCVLLIEMRNLLHVYFDHPLSGITTISRRDPVFQQLLAVKRGTLLQYALIVLTAGAMFTVLLAFQGALEPSAIITIGAAFLLCFFSAVPPIRLQVNGYGEIVEAILVGFLFPALGFSLQGEPSHVLLVMFALPLVFFFLGMRIVQGLKTYGQDERVDRRTLTTMLGWQRSVQVHNLLILAAFLFVGIFLVVGLPWRLAWPIFLGLPLAAFQIYWVIQLSEGGKPRWQFLQFLSTTLLLLETYLISLTLWIN